MRDTCHLAVTARRHQAGGAMLALLLALAIPHGSAQAEDLGRRSFEVCIACHSLKDGENGVGPNLYQIMGRTAGTAEGFRFSGPMKRSAIVWDRTTLGQFLRNPQETIPGTRMPFSGMADEASVQALVNYLETASK